MAAEEVLTSAFEWMAWRGGPSRQVKRGSEPPQDVGPEAVELTDHGRVEGNNLRVLEMSQTRK